MLTETILMLCISVVILLIVFTIFAAILYSGLFDNVNVGAGKSPVKSLVVAYKFVRGPYKNIGDLCTQTSALAPHNRIICVFYDNPNEVPTEECRYVVGSVLAEGDEKKDDSILENLVKNEYKIHIFPQVTNCVRSSFPYRTSLSIYIAIFRVYPVITEYIKEHNLCAHPMMEIYEGDVINYMAPLAKQDEFYVPEAKEISAEDEDDEEDDDDFDESVISDSSINSCIDDNRLSKKSDTPPLRLSAKPLRSKTTVHTED